MSVNHPLTSVIIPVYNCEKYIEENILSVINQTIKEVEIIVIDDGSTDGGRNIINKLIEQELRIKYYYQGNQGVSAARNLGYKKSSGQYIAFFDSDDVWLSNNLEEKIKRIQEDDFGLVHSDAHIIDENSHLLQKTLSGNEGMLLNDMLAWKNSQVPGPSSILVRREVLEKVGNFDINISTAADMDFFIRVASQYKIGRVKKVTWQYRVHQNNMHRNIKTMENDIMYVYTKAKNNNLFYSPTFERRCFSNAYLVLAASWFGDGKNYKRGLFFTLQSIIINPSIVGVLIKKIIKKIMHNKE